MTTSDVKIEICTGGTTQAGAERVDTAGAELEKIVADCVRRMPRDQAPIVAWPLVCGSAVAERTRAIDFSHGILRVEVADTGWQHELQGLAPRYLATINNYVGNSVKRLEFVVPGRRSV